MERVDLAAHRAKKEQEKVLGQELVQEKIKGMQQDTLIQSLGQELALLKIELIQLKGGGI